MGPPASPPLLGDYAGHTKRCREEGRGTGGAQRQESEQRGKWSWRVCQGSATYCTSTPPPSTPPSQALRIPPSPLQAPPHPAERKPPLSQEWQPSLSKSLLQLAVLAVTARRVEQVTVEAILLRRCQYRSKRSSGKELNLTQLLLQSDITCIG